MHKSNNKNKTNRKSIIVTFEPNILLSSKKVMVNLKPTLLYAILSEYYSTCSGCLHNKARIYNVYLSDPIKQYVHKERKYCRQCMQLYFNIIKSISVIVES